jgi:hypothetical protein
MKRRISVMITECDDGTFAAVVHFSNGESRYPGKDFVSLLDAYSWVKEVTELRHNVGAISRKAK